ncbi:MAG TPA: methyltransferase domain-containing protein [Acidimicrobiales bacterium]
MTEPVPESLLARSRLVAALSERGCVRSPRVADAFAAVPRECFVPPMPLERVYRMDEAIPTRFDDEGVPVSSSSAPTIMAVMLEMLAVDDGQRVLEVGAGTGYDAALLSHLVGRGGSVTSVDLDAAVTAEAAAVLANAGFGDVRVVAGDGWLGRPGECFDRMIVTAECWDLSPAWVEQLADGGRLVVPLWLRPALTVAVAFEKVASGAGSEPDHAVLVSRALTYCGFMPLRGPHGGPPRRAILPDVPWDLGDAGDGGDGGDARDANRRRWIAHLDEATDERVGTLRDLLHSPASVRPAPGAVPGWRFRLSLKEPDAVCIFTMFPPLRDAVGLFDADARSLAVLEGERMHCFGHPSCGDRLEALLPAPAPLELSVLSISASSHRDVTPPPESGSTVSYVLPRENFDFAVREGSAEGS